MISSVRFEDLAIERGGRMLFQGLSAAVGSGEALAVTGANGSGKTSLLRAIAGLLAPAAGRIDFEGVEDAGEARRAGLHLVGHQDGLKGARTAREELLFQARWCGGTDRAALAAAERLGLARQLDLETRRLSAGQKRRLALARLLAAPRTLWLLDEPLAPLDAAGRELMGAILAEHLAGGGLVIAAAHDPLPVAARRLEIGG
ncbi:MAG TPA: heme ABC exporter ATP-binding protein CcmA [Caulobacteraceae bacterium]